MARYERKKSQLVTNEAYSLVDEMHFVVEECSYFHQNLQDPLRLTFVVIDELRRWQPFGEELADPWLERKYGADSVVKSETKVTGDSYQVTPVIPEERDV